MYIGILIGLAIGLGLAALLFVAAYAWISYHWGNSK